MAKKKRRSDEVGIGVTRARMSDKGKGTSGSCRQMKINNTVFIE